MYSRSFAERNASGRINDGLTFPSLRRDVTLLLTSVSLYALIVAISSSVSSKQLLTSVGASDSDYIRVEGGTEETTECEVPFRLVNFPFGATASINNSCSKSALFLIPSCPPPIIRG